MNFSKVTIAVLGRGPTESGKTSLGVESEDRSSDDGCKNNTVEARATAGTEGTHVVRPNSNQLDSGVSSY